MRNFDYASELGQDLTEYTLLVDPMAVSTAESGDVRVKQAEILVEMKFPPDYPHSAPQFRLIRPGLRLQVYPVKFALRIMISYDYSRRTQFLV